MNPFVIRILCRVLSSYIHDDETLNIEYSEIVDLEKFLVGEYIKFPEVYDDILTKYQIPLLYRFEYLANEMKNESNQLQRPEDTQ